jgi:hypothetical protein
MFSLIVSKINKIVESSKTKIDLHTLHLDNISIYDLLLDSNTSESKLLESLIIVAKQDILNKLYIKEKVNMQAFFDAIIEVDKLQLQNKAIVEEFEDLLNERNTLISKIETLELKVSTKERKKRVETNKAPTLAYSTSI